MNTLTVKKKDVIKRIEENGIGELLKPLTREIYIGSFTICDLFNDRASTIKELKQNQELVLRRENVDEDDFFVGVELLDGKRIGALNVLENEIIARLLDAGKKIVAKVEHIVLLPEYSAVKVGLYMIEF